MGLAYLLEAQRYLPDSASRLALLAFVNIPVIAIVLNVLRQLKPSSPPEVFHLIPFVGSAPGYGNDPIAFFDPGSAGNNFILGGKVAYLSAEDAYTCWWSSLTIKAFTTPVFGKDVVYDCPNEKLMEQKKFIKFGLSMDNMRVQFLRKDPSFRTFQMNDINEWGQFDVLKVTQEITILTASRTLQGKEVRGNMDATFAQLFTIWMSYRKRDRAQKKMAEFYINIVKARKEGTSTNDEPDMISALMGQTYRNGTQLPDHEIAHIMIALLMAGQHTSSATAAWALLHLADQPNVAFRDRETLRMHPPIHSIMRYVRDDFIVPGTLSAPSKDSQYVVPKGHYVLASPAVSQVDKTLWLQSGEWMPSRWTDPEGQAQKAFKQYSDENGEKIDYGFGAHRCIGEQFAYLQLGVVLSTVVRSIEMRIPGGVPPPNYHTMITLPKQPRMISYRRRKFD
ncbi:cytochrome P450 [Russula vinacea]|nr:cytochrome P450 [Russula vinacea]